MKHISLTQGQVALVDEADFDYLLDIGNWCYGTANGYALHFGRNDEGGRTTTSMHRLIMARALGNAVPKELHVDHIDRDRLNNTRANLRLATRLQNQANRSVPRNSATRFKGVSLDGRRFRVRLRFNRRKSLHLGQFDDPEFGARVYDAASRLLNRDFAGLNFADEQTTPEILALVMTFIERSPEALAFINREE